MNDPVAGAASPRYAPPEPDAAPEEFVRWANALPMCQHLHIVCASLSRGEGVFRVAEVPLSPNPNGSVHGGLVSAIADQCLGIVSVVNSPPGQLSVTATLQGQFHRPALTPLTVRTRLVAAGRRLIFVELFVEDFQDRRCASFQATMIVGGEERRDR